MKAHGYMVFTVSTLGRFKPEGGVVKDRDSLNFQFFMSQTDEAAQLSRERIARTRHGRPPDFRIEVSYR